MSQHHEETQENLGTPMRRLALQVLSGFVVAGGFALIAWNSSASGFAGLSLNAAQDLKNEEFLQALSNKLSALKLTSRVNTRERSIKIFASDVNFEANSAQLNSRQSQALSRVAQLIQAALQCTDSTSELQLAAKPLEQEVIPKSQCHQGEKIEFACESLFRDIKVKKIFVSANEPSHSVVAEKGTRRTRAQVLNQRNEVLVNALQSCEPELRRFSYADSKPLLRPVEDRHAHVDTARYEHERLQLQFEFD